MEIEDREYERIIKEREDALTAARVADEAKAEAERKVAEAEAAKTAAEEAKEAAELKVTEAEAAKTKLEEQANAQTLRDQRFEALGSAFREKIDSMPTTKANLLKDAAEMQDEAWGTRLGEIEELTSVKRDAQKDGTETTTVAREGLFEREEVARFGGGSQTETTTAKEPTLAERRSVMSGLGRKPEKKAS